METLGKHKITWKLDKWGKHCYQYEERQESNMLLPGHDKAENTFYKITWWLEKKVPSGANIITSMRKGEEAICFSLAITQQKIHLKTHSHTHPHTNIWWSPTACIQPWERLFLCHEKNLATIVSHWLPLSLSVFTYFSHWVTNQCATGTTFGIYWDWLNVYGIASSAVISNLDHICSDNYDYD